jgi:hypothetical protein
MTSIIIDDDDDEVHRICRTPGDPCGCTRQYFQRSGLPLPSTWNKYWSVSSSWLCSSLMSSTFSCLSLTDLSHLPRVQLHFWCHPFTAYGASLSSLLLQLFPALYISPRIDVPSSRAHYYYLINCYKTSNTVIKTINWRSRKIFTIRMWIW